MGTRFNLFVQPPFDDPQATPEVIEVSSPAGSLGPGPSDDRMYAVAPIGKARPYGQSRGMASRDHVYLPPWDGPVAPPAMPSPDGHFDHLLLGDPGFETAHLFGCVRFTLDVWERYLGGPFPFHFQQHFERLEICNIGDWDNAQFGYGFLETGSHEEDDGRILPFSMSFDIIAHELGHGVIYATMGTPPKGTELPEYLGFQESAADMISLLAVMHFPSVIDDVLENTRGNLYRANRIARFSEFSRNSQIRTAANDRTMAEFANGWNTEHDLSEPLTGAMFDLMLDIYHECLKADGLISPELEDLSDRAQDDPRLDLEVQAGFDDVYARNRDGFHQTLLEVRDVIGFFYGEMILRLGPAFLDYVDIGRTLVEIDQQQNKGLFTDLILHNFRRRKIGDVDAGPRLKKPGRKSHTESDRTWVPR